MGKQAKVTAPVRGGIYLVNFDPALGSEIKKTRPALVLQNDIANKYSPITVVAALTSQISPRRYPTEVLISAAESGLPTNSLALLNQIRSVDERRLGKKIGTVSAATMRKVERALEISLGLIVL